MILSQVNSLLWTRQMWDLPLPYNLTACKCGEGSMKRLFKDEGIVNEGDPSTTTSNYAGLREECQDEAKSDEDSVEGNWEVVSRFKHKKIQV